MSKEKRTLLGLLVGNIIYAAIVSCIGAFFAEHRLSFVLGVFWSSIGACIVTLHLYFSLQKSLDMLVDDAIKYQRSQAVIRTLIMIMVGVFGFALQKWMDMYGILLGMFALKVSSYVQPFFIGQEDVSKENQMEL